MTMSVVCDGRVDLEKFVARSEQQRVEDRCRNGGGATPELKGAVLAPPRIVLEGVSASADHGDLADMLADDLSMPLRNGAVAEVIGRDYSEVRR